MHELGVQHPSPANAAPETERPPAIATPARNVFHDRRIISISSLNQEKGNRDRPFSHEGTHLSPIGTVQGCSAVTADVELPAESADPGNPRNRQYHRGYRLLFSGFPQLRSKSAYGAGGNRLRCCRTDAMEQPFATIKLMSRLTELPEAHDCTFGRCIRLRNTTLAVWFATPRPVRATGSLSPIRYASSDLRRLCHTDAGSSVSSSDGALASVRCVCLTFLRLLMLPKLWFLLRLGRYLCGRIESGDSICSWRVKWASPICRRWSCPSRLSVPRGQHDLPLAAQLHRLFGIRVSL